MSVLRLVAEGSCRMTCRILDWNPKIYYSFIRWYWYLSCSETRIESAWYLQRKDQMFPIWSCICLCFVFCCVSISRSVGFGLVEKRESVSYFLPPHLSPSSEENTSCRVEFFQTPRDYFLFLFYYSSSNSFLSGYLKRLGLPRFLLELRLLF